MRMRRLIFGLAALLMLGACSAGPPMSIDGIEDAAQAAEGETLAKRWADDLLGEVSLQEDRAVRMCMIGAVATELVAFRMTKEPDQAAMGYGQIATLRAAVDRFVAADGMWLNVEVAHVTLAMTEIMVDSAKARIPKLLSNFAGGVNVLGLLDRAAIAAGQGTLLSAGIADIRARVVALNAGTADPAASLVACQARMVANQQKVGAMIGAVAVVEPGGVP